MNEITQHNDWQLAAAERRAYWQALEKKDSRIIWFALIGVMALCIVGMVFNTGIASTGTYLSLVGLSIQFVFIVAFGVFIGLFPGLVFAFVALLCLRRRDLRMAALLIYGPTFAAMVLIMMLPSTVLVVNSWMIFSILFVMASGLTILCRFVLPEKPLFRPAHVCPICWYDLRGTGRTGCPECGWGRGDQVGAGELGEGSRAKPQAAGARDQ